MSINTSTVPVLLQYKIYSTKILYKNIIKLQQVSNLTETLCINS